MKLAPDENPGADAGSLLKFVHRNRRLISLSYRKLALVGALSVIAGLGQAALLLVIVRGATALTAGTEDISGSVGPISASDLATGDLVLLGFALLGLLLVVEIATSFVQAALIVDASTGAQRRMLATYSAATYDAQTTLTRGEARQVVMGHPTASGGIAAALGSGLSAATNFVVLVGSAVVLSPVAALVVLVGLVVMMGALRPILRTTRRLSHRKAREQRAVSGLAAERFELNKELKAFGAEFYADAAIRDGIERVAREDRRVRVLSRLSSVVYRLGVFALVLAMLALIDASNSTNLAALTGALLMLLRSLSYGQAAQGALQSLGETVPVIEQLVEEHDRLCRSLEPRTGSSRSVPPDDFHIGAVTFDRVDFAYPGFERVLHRVSLDIAPGEFVALVGPSGAGKSTLMQLLLRLRRPIAGQILVDDSPMEDVPLEWWRRRVSYVSQEPKLQSGTVSEAIRLGRLDFSEADVRRAAERARVANEIESWQHGYDTPVGQLGEGVSGGQRQRLALARALLGNPDLLLLDEPTSALDPRSERLVAQTLEELRGTVTIVVIAHRLHTVEHADRVVRIDHGHIKTQEDGLSIAELIGDDVITSRQSDPMS